MVTGLAALLIAIGFVSFQFLSTAKIHATSLHAEARPTAHDITLAVLPFANLSGDPAQDYLADVITEGLTTALSRIKGAFVIARTAA